MAFQLICDICKKVFTDNPEDMENRLTYESAHGWSNTTLDVCSRCIKRIRKLGGMIK